MDASLAFSISTFNFGSINSSIKKKLADLIMFFRAFSKFNKNQNLLTLSVGFWASIHPSWGHVRSHTKLGPDRFRRFEVDWKQTKYKRTDRQTDKQTNKKHTLPDKIKNPFLHLFRNLLTGQSPRYCLCWANCCTPWSPWPSPPYSTPTTVSGITKIFYKSLTFLT